MTFDAEGTLLDDRRPETEAGRKFLAALFDATIHDGPPTFLDAVFAIEAQARERVLDELRGRVGDLPGLNAPRYTADDFHHWKAWDEIAAIIEELRK